MQAYLTINTVSFTPWVKSIEQSPVYRNSRVVVTLDGKKHQKSVEKTQLHVSLCDMTDTDLAALKGAATPLSNVSYLDDDGTARTAVPFFASNFTSTSKIVRDGVTYHSGISLDLEEQ